MKAYLSNVSPAWPIKRQEELLRQAIPDWQAADVRRDVLDSQQLMAHRPSSLRQLERLLKPASFKRADTVMVASFAVLGWRPEDLLTRLIAAAARGFTVRALDVGLDIGPGSTPADMQKALDAFASGKARASERKRGEAGGKVSADRRKAAKAPGIKAIADKWGWPSNREMAEKWGFPGHPYVSTDELKAEAQATYNTIKAHTGFGREAAQAKYREELQRKATREARKRK